MPAKSLKQLKYIYYLRNKYKNKKSTPLKNKWIWGKEWGHMESILNFNNFVIMNENIKFENECWKEAKVGDILSEDIIYQYVQSLHRDKSNFWEGDLSERIENYTQYQLKEVNISEIDIDDWEIDDSDVNEYKIKTRNTNDYPPIILDDKQWGKYSIIDGTHRANALHELKHKTIKAWVGIFDPKRH